jgi:hypothetical protein
LTRKENAMTTTKQYLYALEAVMIDIAKTARELSNVTNDVFTRANKDDALDRLTKASVYDVLHELYSTTSKADLAKMAIQTALMTIEQETGD